jgi:hypothetical protein
VESLAHHQRNSLARTENALEAAGEAARFAKLRNALLGKRLGPGLPENT